MRCTTGSSVRANRSSKKCTSCSTRAMSPSKAVVLSALLLLAGTVQACTEARCVVLRTPQWVYHFNSGWNDACAAGLHIHSIHREGMQSESQCFCRTGYCLAYRCTADSNKQHFSGLGRLGTGTGATTGLQSFRTSSSGSYEISTSLPGSSAEYHWSDSGSGAGWRLYAVRENCLASSAWLTIT